MPQVPAVHASEKLAERSMELQCTAQEGQIYFSNATGTVQVELGSLKK